MTMSVAVAQPGAPKGSPPVFKIVASVDQAKGHIVFHEFMYKSEPRVEKRKVVKNGQEVIEEVTVMVQVPFMMAIPLDATASRVITPDGKQLPIDEVWKRVKAKTAVVVSTDHNTPDPAFLRALNADTLIIIPSAPPPIKAPKN
jgi:hypothetical protein